MKDERPIPASIISSLVSTTFHILLIIDRGCKALSEKLSVQSGEDCPVTLFVMFSQCCSFSSQSDALLFFFYRSPTTKEQNTQSLGFP